MCTVPSPGGQVSEMAGPSTAAATSSGQGVASHRPPGGLPHGNSGAEPDDARTVLVGTAPEPPCGRAVPGRRDATRAPTCKIIGGPTASLRSLVGKAPDKESGARQADTRPARARKRRASSPTSVGTSTATDDHKRPRTLDARIRPALDKLQVVAGRCLRLRIRR
jgi:hypothetical protein